MFNTVVGAGAASRYGFGSNQKMGLHAAPALAPAPQHCFSPLALMLAFKLFFLQILQESKLSWKKHFA
jgi:hypothetical protein